MSDTDWARCAPFLEAALAHAGGGHALSDVRALAQAGEARLWPGAASAMVTIVEEEPRQRRLLIWLAGGDLDELVGTVRPRAEAWARAQGCRQVILAGRPGWERALARHGYAPLARLIAKDL